MRNLGERRANMRIAEKSTDYLDIAFQVIEDVHKPLLAVSKIVEAGNSVIFSQDDPHIQIKDGPKLPLKLVGGTYELEMWVKNEPEKPEAGFSRQSQVR